MHYGATHRCPPGSNTPDSEWFVPLRVAQSTAWRARQLRDRIERAAHGCIDAGNYAVAEKLARRAARVNALYLWAGGPSGAAVWWSKPPPALFPVQEVRS